MKKIIVINCDDCPCFIDDRQSLSYQCGVNRFRVGIRNRIQAIRDLMIHCPLEEE